MPPCCSSNQGDEFDPEYEGPSDADIERFGSDTRPCPSCGAEIYDDAPFCHACGDAIAEQPKPHRKIKLILTAAILIIFFMIVIRIGGVTAILTIRPEVTPQRSSIT